MYLNCWSQAYFRYLLFFEVYLDLSWWDHILRKVNLLRNPVINCVICWNPWLILHVIAVFKKTFLNLFYDLSIDSLSCYSFAISTLVSILPPPNIVLDAFVVGRVSYKATKAIHFFIILDAAFENKTDAKGWDWKTSTQAVHVLLLVMLTNLNGFDVVLIKNGLANYRDNLVWVSIVLYL